MDPIEDEILKHLASLVGGHPQLADSLALIGVDSVGMAELTFELERQFGIRVNEDVVDVETVGELVDYVRAKVELKKDAGKNRT